MDKFMALSDGDKRDAFQTAANEKGIVSTIIEKDFWVCFLLNILFTKSAYRKYLVFKGGTSLSKGYNAIQRFSEDIDLVLDWTALGYEQNTPWEDRSKTKQNNFNK